MRTSFLNKILQRFGFQIFDSGEKVEMVGLKEIKVLRRAFGYFLFLLLVWGLYRFLFKLPENVEELILKPIIWLVSLAWVVFKLEKKPLSSLGLSSKGIFKSLYLGIGLGLVFALEAFLVNIAKYGRLSLPEISYSGGEFVVAFLVSVVTAFCEELAFRGFIFNRLFGVWKKEWQTNLVVSFLFTLIHLPITIFVLHYSLGQLLSYGLIVFIYSLGAGFVFARTQTVTGSTLLHIFWSWPIILFR